MSEAAINIKVETYTDSSYVPSFTVRISVVSTDGITPCIFVHEYVPKLPCNEEEYSFVNVAYYDELTSVPDYIKDRRTPGLVRKSVVEMGFPTKERLEDFIATVQHDIQRLLTQLNTTTATGQCLDVEITAGTVSQTISDDCGSGDINPINTDVQTAPGVVTLTFDGSTIATF